MSRVLATMLLLCVCRSAAAVPLDYGDPTEPAPGFGKAPTAQAEFAVEDEAVPAPPRWRLTSTLVAGERRVAVINGRSVALGARIEGAKLLAVDARGALIEHEGRRIRLDMPAPRDRTITAKRPSSQQ